MSETSYDVRIYKTDVWVSKKKGGKTTYWVRWKVANRLPLFKLPFRTSTLADSFRSSLVTAARQGEAFRLSDGLPLSMARERDATPPLRWYEFACSYVDMKWKAAAATYRRSIAEAMVTVTMAMLVSAQSESDARKMRSALFKWGFNSQLRTSNQVPADVQRILAWVHENTRPVADLADVEHLRPVMDATASKLDGTPIAATVANRKRALLHNALDYAVERKLLNANPVPKLKWSAPKRVSYEVDRRSVVNPIQARTLLNAIRNTPRSGPQLYACFACSYFAGLRPEEAISIRREDVTIPALVWDAERRANVPPKDDWGELSLRHAAPHAGRDWTDSGLEREERGLKHRPDGEERPVPIPPELTKILRQHIAEFPPDSEGRLFYGIQRGGSVPVFTYNEIWRRARAYAFAPEVLGTPLGKTPYTLRHAAVSTWLAGGVDATQVAEWAGHSVEVLLKVYAKCLHGRDGIARAAMGRSYL